MTSPIWLVTGAGGMLGHDLVGLLEGADIRVHPLTRAQFDISDASACDHLISTLQPDLVINLAAWTDVDGAEEEPDAARAVNTLGPENVAIACRNIGARMIHMSTDYVFDGTASAPYHENATHRPVNTYGRTKADSEVAVLQTLPDTSAVLRTAWLYGVGGRNFVSTMARLARERETVDVVDDQTGQPTWTTDVARRIIELGQAPTATGVFHATNSGSATWYQLARAVFRLLEMDPDRVRPTTSDQFPRRAARPRYSVLGHGRWANVGMPPMRHWEAALRSAAPGVLGPV